jgi:hypothetical protein
MWANSLLRVQRGSLVKLEQNCHGQAGEYLLKGRKDYHSKPTCHNQLSLASLLLEYFSLLV